VKFFYALALLLALTFGYAPLAMAHGTAHDCPEMTLQVDTQSNLQPETESVAKEMTVAKQAPCHTDCPEQHKMSKDGCCMSATTCHSVVLNNFYQPASPNLARNIKVTGNLPSAYTSAIVAGPQRPPQYI
jgi:hypothetical protein